MPAVHTTLSLHSLPDGSSHVDWFIDLPPLDGLQPVAAGLTTFRCPERPDLSADPMELELLGEHRRVYLDYEGPVSGNRGTVRVLAKGLAQVLLRTEDRLALAADFGHAPLHFNLVSQSRPQGPVWLCTVSPA